MAGTVEIQLSAFALTKTVFQAVRIIPETYIKVTPMT